MIRVYSENFTKKDYENLATVFYNGLRTVAPLSNCTRIHACKYCECHRICVALMKAAEYCDKKAAEMVES